MKKGEYKSRQPLCSCLLLFYMASFTAFGIPGGYGISGGYWEMV